MIIKKATIEKKEKAQIKKKVKELQKELYYMQQSLKTAGVPVVVAIEGFGASGKGEIIAEIIAELDPRQYQVQVKPGIKAEDKRYPFMKASWDKLPKKGDISILNHSWYYKAFSHAGDNPVKKSILDRITNFERMLADDGYCVIKIFLDISKKEQKSRMDTLLSSEGSAWRVSESDMGFYENFDKKRELMEDLIEKTATKSAPWHVIDSTEKWSASFNVLDILVSTLKSALKKDEVKTKPRDKDFEILPTKKLSQIDLNVSIDPKDYKKELKKEKDELKKLHGILYKRRIPVILAFEGWDAAGKGGAIRRLSWALDPRGFEVIPVAAPTSEEINRHYLWRFWQKLPRDGHVAIFDRTWYGRVMVERVEGFAPQKRWEQAFDEMNEFEASMAKWGAIVIKFFIHIDKDEQLKRFTDRQQNPEKQYKITDEDWRNREKWDEYETAIDEMIQKTSTKNAPWVIVEGNDKKYARIKIIKTVRMAIEEFLNA